MDWREERNGREERDGRGRKEEGSEVGTFRYTDSCPSLSLSPSFCCVSPSFLPPFFSFSLSFSSSQKLDIQDNPNLVMPPKPTEQVKGSGAEWYNIDFDPEILKGGAVVASATVILSAHHKRKAGV